MRLALSAEWTKLRTVPDAPVALVLAVGLTVAVSAVAAATAGAGSDAVHVSLLGVQVGQAVVAVAGVQVLAGEEATGLIRGTFTALPRRLSVLAAKASLLLGGTVVAAVLAVFLSVLVGRSLVDGYPPVWSASVLRAGGGSVLYLCLVGLLGLGVAAAVRGAAAASGLVLGLLYLVPAVLNAFLNPSWQRWLYRLSPSTAGLTVQTTVDAGALPIGPWAGLGVAAAWAAVACGVGAFLLCRRDV